ncbi:ankyrin repeat-containing protein ITN1-like protein, partial [Tanacetum coccineum]
MLGGTLSDVDDEDLDLGERNIKQCKKEICDGHYTAAVRVLSSSSSSGVAPYSDATFYELFSTKHPFQPAPSLPHIPIDHHPIIASSTADGYLDGLQFGVGVSRGSEAILHSVNRLIKACGDDVGLLMLLYYGEHTLWSCQGVQQGYSLGPLLFDLVLHPLICKIRDSFILSLHAWYLDDGTIVGDTLVVGKVLELIMKEGPGCGLHLNVDKTEVFWPKKDPPSKLARIFPPNIARPLYGIKLLGGPASVIFDFCNELVMKRVAKPIVLIDAIAKINDPQCELLLLRSCTSISRLYFTMCTCPPRVFESAQRSFDVALRSSLESIATASGLGFGDWQWRVATLPFAFGGLGVYSASDVLNYAFLASRLQSVGLQTKLFWHIGIVASGPIFDDALSMFNTSIETELLCNPSEIVAPKLMKKMADIFHTG